MVDPKAYAQLPALLPEESRRKRLDDSTGKEFLGRLAFVAHNVYSLKAGKDVAIVMKNQSPARKDTRHLMVLILHIT